MGKKKFCKNLFETDLRKERAPFLDADLHNWTPDMGYGLADNSGKLHPACFVQPTDLAPMPRMTRVESYRAPPLQLTLETIEEDKPDFFQRSKSVPIQRRFSLDSTGHGLHRLPSYRPGQCGYGVSMSGPMTFQRDEEFSAKPHRSRFSRMRETLRCNRFREAFALFLSRMRPSSRRSS